MAPNQKELAKLAGVSTGTVSNVISGSTRVGERSRQKVLEAIKILGYQPNLIARSLRTNRTRTLGIVVPDITIPFFPKIIRGAEAAARENGYFLIVLDSEGNPEREADMMALLRAQRVEGVLLVTATSEEEAPERLGSLMEHFPVVCLDRLPTDLDVDAVCVDGRGAAAMAVSHLIEMGHTRIACLTGPQTLLNEKERLRGYKQALQKHGIPMESALIWNCGFDQQHVARICREGFRESGKPSALFATNGVTGLAALRGLYADGLGTPHDFAFVTFDEITAEEFFRPGITSVVQPTYDMGHQAVEVLLKRIGAGEMGLPNKKVRLPASLQVRDSSRMPNSAIPFPAQTVDRRRTSR